MPTSWEGHAGSGVATPGPGGPVPGTRVSEILQVFHPSIKG